MVTQRISIIITHTHTYKHITQLIWFREQVTLIILGMTHTLQVKTSACADSVEVCFSTQAVSPLTVNSNSLIFLFCNLTHPDYECEDLRHWKARES